ncbi:Olfactory receptor 56A1 [Heterocephalus glaber]|uniref:Olfactory receptor 56A1 n=1 Tax=Heterocephalus glaber TaxID=10181 RepID=G5BBS7_HETGA|nr:Olfactory receptor 56A1 [Heterocephalus glaber]
MKAYQNDTTSTGLSDFLLNCFVRAPNWQLWLSLPLSLLFLLAMGANAVLLVTIRMEASLHEPMYYLLSLLSLLDIVLCLTVIPKVLAIFWFDSKSISFSACFLQMFIMNSFLAMESCTFMVMAFDRYIAICHPLRYPSIINDQFFAGGWTLLGSDLILIFLSYTLILRAVLRLKAEGAVAKALSTCSSHFILILFFSTILLVFVLTHVTKKKVPPDVPVLLNVLHHVIPAALNPIVYGVRTQEIKQGIQRLLKKGWS